MNVLFIFSRHSRTQEDSTLTKDLADAFYEAGHDVTVVTMLEKRELLETSLTNEHGYNVLRVKTGNYFNTNKFEKAITIFTLASDFVNGVKSRLGNKKIDLIITHTPFVSTHKIIRPLKKHFKCPAYLLLWDIFPQNAIDLGILKNKFLIKYFRWQEKLMFESYDLVFCNSLGGMHYLLKHYPYIDEGKLELQYSFAKIKSIHNLNKHKIRGELGYSECDFISVFGGNMGIPQKLENILILARNANKALLNAKFLFIGSGTEANKLVKLADHMELSNVKFIEQLPRDEYEKFIAVADIGLISLNECYSTPNFPGKTLDYFKLQLPILASLDNCAAQDYGYFLTDIARAGRFASAGNHEELFECYMKLYSDASLREVLGRNGRQFYEQEFDAVKACNKICEKFKIFSDARI